MSGAALENTLGALEGRALFDGEEREVFVRVGKQEGTLYLDLANERGEVVEIGEFGWKISTSPAVRFLHPQGMMALPVPAKAGDGLRELRGFLNLSHEHFVLIVSWVVAVLRALGPYPVLVLNSEKGAGKTMTTKILRSLIDPNVALVRGAPRDERDLMVAASHSWIQAYDNLSPPPEWLSNCFCRLSTGGGFATRKLYSDDEQQLFCAQRPIILNGITEIVTREDLIDRSILVSLPTIPKKKKVAEEKI